MVAALSALRNITRMGAFFTGVRGPLYPWDEKNAQQLSGTHLFGTFLGSFLFKYFNFGGIMQVVIIIPVSVIKVVVVLLQHSP